MIHLGRWQEDAQVNATGRYLFGTYLYLIGVLGVCEQAERERLVFLSQIFFLLKKIQVPVITQT